MDFDMKTEESKLKASFTKKMSLNSGTSTNSTVKVPVLVHSSPKPPHARPCVYQAKLPKPKATPSSCTNIKNPWVMWSSVVFAAVVIIIVFASLQGKTSADLKKTKKKVEELESVIDAMRKNIAEMEVRVQCATSDNGTDGRGNPCPARGGGKTGFLKEKRKGEKSESTGNPTQKSKNKQNGATTPSQTSSQTGSRTTKRRQSTVYTYWGSGKCPNSDGVRTVYSGKVASLYSRSKALVGSEFLCIPKRVEYTDFKNMTSGLYLSPVKYGVNMSIFRKIGPEQCKSWGPTCDKFKKTKPELFKNLDFFQVPCAVCLRERRTATLVTPGRNMCHSGWWKEYIGYLMTNHHGDSAQHICVGADSDGVPGSNSTETRGPLLQPVAYKCNGPGCPTNLDISDKKLRALTCVVCTI